MQVRSSRRLRRVLMAVLAVGNALNDGTSHGGAVGFRLDSLLKLAALRVLRFALPETPVI